MDTLNDVWKAVLAICRTKVSEVMYNMWLSPLELVKFENDTVVFCINTDFKKTIIQDKFGDVLRESFEEVMGFPVDIDIIVSEISAGSKPVPAAEKTDDAEEAEEAEEEKTPTGYEAYTFDNFIVGKSNNFAYSICVGVAQNPGNYSNPLLIYGRSGLGKTHLSLSIAGEVISRGYNAVYNSAQNIFTELNKEHFGRSDISFSYEAMILDCDLLVIDDLGAEFATQFTNAALYNIINTRINYSLPTIINTNLSLKELEEKYTRRISSRIIGEYAVLDFFGYDIRQIKNEQ